ncbi:hypothetical protein EJ03DRAFT_108983 [Teratosphaeria nubilosa]|uniref:Uncharacterized protein n=1 Tax=Teratosphaeria nubilosa TaxID=161662 RepID=A0A6G1L820_9PEZI|nr:hypothetical protein EJ03DRAFT_108983 [Teratosphaeria nubilosa]
MGHTYTRSSPSPRMCRNLTPALHLCCLWPFMDDNFLQQPLLQPCQPHLRYTTSRMGVATVTTRLFTAIHSSKAVTGRVADHGRSCCDGTADGKDNGVLCRYDAHDRLGSDIDSSENTALACIVHISRMPLKRDASLAPFSRSFPSVESPRLCENQVFGCLACLGLICKVTRTLKPAFLMRCVPLESEA